MIVNMIWEGGTERRGSKEGGFTLVDVRRQDAADYSPRDNFRHFFPGTGRGPE